MIDVSCLISDGSEKEGRERERRFANFKTLTSIKKIIIKNKQLTRTNNIKINFGNYIQLIIIDIKCELM